MRVDPSGSHVPLPPAAATPPAAKAPASSETPAASPEAGSHYKRTADLTRLMEALRGFPENRDKTVAGVLARLAAGEFDTPQAAADTARAMLDDQAAG